MKILKVAIIGISLALAVSLLLRRSSGVVVPDPFYSKVLKNARFANTVELLQKKVSNTRRFFRDEMDDWHGIKNMINNEYNSLSSDQVKNFKQLVFKGEHILEARKYQMITWFKIAKAFDAIVTIKSLSASDEMSINQNLICIYSDLKNMYEMTADTEYCVLAVKDALYQTTT